jgi:hypothetical protein
MIFSKIEWIIINIFTYEKYFFSYKYMHKNVHQRKCKPSGDSKMKLVYLWSLSINGQSKAQRVGGHVVTYW